MEARSLSFISPHEGNITGVSLQEGCDNTAATAAHYRRVSLACNPPAFLTFSALSSASAAKDPLLSSEPRERERIDYPTVRRQSQGIAEWAQGLLNLGQPTSSSG